MDWQAITESARNLAGKMGSDYLARVNFEIKEIEKQGGNDYWISLIVAQKKFEKNKNGLVIPFLFQLTDIDPVKEAIPHNISYQPDFPDIDTDFLPHARDEIKRYASEMYGTDKVCTVGNWNTLLLKQALLDACRIMDGDMIAVGSVTKTLSEPEFDKMTMEELCSKNIDFKHYHETHPDVVDLAWRLKGRIKSQGQHAGGIIISSVPLADVVPMSYIKGKAVSQWTEGMAASQLSKFGLVKFDILGLKTMAYNVYSEELIKKTRGILIDWSVMDPVAAEPYAGRKVYDDGRIEPVLFNDPLAIKTADEVKTEAVFQFDTPVAKGVLANGVRTWNDLTVYTAMGRPGPMDMIPEYVNRRDDPDQLWKKREDSRVVELLKSTYGVICYQEQLAAFWIKFCGLTVPEAEKARKMVAKKKGEEVLKLKPRIIQGMVRSGFAEKVAAEWWEKMVTFGRYAFNLSHATAYAIIAYRSLYLKAHFAPEFWASILTFCHPDKLIKYIGVAKYEGVKFRPLMVGHLSDKFVVDSALNVYPSLAMVAGIGKSAARNYSMNGGQCSDIDDFVIKYNKSKSVIERLIKLGAFDHIHNNRKALWMWYLYKYSSKNPESDEARKMITDHFMWPEDKLIEERARQKEAFQKQFPKKRVPIKILNWKPQIGHNHARPTRDEVFNLIEDFSLKEKLQFEKKFLGVYWSSPMDLYLHKPSNDFAGVREEGVSFVDAVVESVSKGQTKKGIKYTNYSITDGKESNVVKVWKDAADYQDKLVWVEGAGVRLAVEWSEKFKGFNLARNTSISILTPSEKAKASAKTR